MPIELCSVDLLQIDQKIEDLSARLIFCLNYRNMSQTELAKAIGVSPQNIQALCSGKIQKSRYINEIAIYLKVDPLWLATGSSALKTHYPTQLTEVSQIPILSWEKIDEENQMPYEGMVGGTFDHSDLSYALKIKDDSMSPKFEVGDVLLVSANDKPEHGDYVIANILANSLKICRKYQNENKSKLVALNPGYGVIHYKDTKFEIIGIVKESRMNLRV